MKFIKKFFNDLIYVGLTKEEFNRVKKSVNEKNRNHLVTWSALFGLFWAISMIIYHDAKYAAARIVFAVSIAASVFALLLALLLIKRVPWMLHPVMYFLMLSSLGTGVALSLVQPTERIATIVATAIIAPVLFIDSTITMIVLEVVTIIAYAVLGKNILAPDVYTWGVTIMSIFSVAGLLIGHEINKARFERYIFAESAINLADIQKKYNEDLKKEVAAKTAHVVALHNQLIVGIATMVESRDNTTGGHIRRTSTGVRILVEEMKRGENALGLSDGFCEKLIEAAPMHDLGKITVEDAILCKPGRYTPEEFNKMKTHAAEGARIIHDILKDSDDDEFRRIAENVAHYHHERVDGSGYPDGLKGDEIPLEARIMAIADVYDALVSKRQYKECYSFDEANRIILDEMGTHFDKELQKYYVAARPRLEAFYSSNKS